MFTITESPFPIRLLQHFAATSTVSHEYIASRYGSTSTGNGRGFREGEIIFFRCGSCVNWAQVNASYPLEGEGEVEGAVEGVDEEGRKSEGKLSMMCWNVCGWCKGGRQIDQMRGELDIRAEVINFYTPDIVALVETWLKGNE